MRTATLWNPWQELDSFRREVSALLGNGPRWAVPRSACQPPATRKSRVVASMAPSLRLSC